jgi:hypothetical protein
MSIEDDTVGIGESSRRRGNWSISCWLDDNGAFIVASAATIVDDDITDVRRGSLAAQNSPAPMSDGVATVV